MSHVVHIESLAFGGSGVGHLEDGRAVFVAQTAPGDVAEIEIDKDKHSYAIGHMSKLVTPGEHRVKPACPWAGICGGCDWQHIDYKRQIQTKRANVISELARIALPAITHTSPDECMENARHLVRDIVASPHPFGYRNKIEMAAENDDQGNLHVGFRAQASHRIVSVNSCLLAQKPMQQAPHILQGALRYIQGSSNLNLLRVEVRQSERTHQTEIALWTKPGAFPRSEAVRVLRSALHATSIVHVIADPGRKRMIRGVERLWGAGRWSEKLGETTYTVSAPSFFQVNSNQAEHMIAYVGQLLQGKHITTIADLYCGVGTFTLPLSQIATNVYAVEREGSSVRDLRRNVEINHRDNIDVIGGDSARELSGLGHLDALVVDPPRQGLAKSIPHDIADAHPETLIYVSCDAGTWARDVARLHKAGYTLVHATPFDLFPQTYHCEIVSEFRPQK